MRQGARSRTLAVAALVAIATLGFVAVASAGDSVQTFDVGVSACEHPVNLELCSPPSSVSIKTDGVLRVEFVASPNHCSSVMAHLQVDGVERYTSGPIGPGQSTGPQDLGPVSIGTHEVGVQVEGIPAGCNTGTAQSWAGKLTVVVSSRAEVTSTAIASAVPASVSPTPVTATPVSTVGGDSSLFPVILGAGLLIAGALAVSMILKRGAGLDAVAIPPNPIVPLNRITPSASSEAVRSLVDAMSRELNVLSGQLGLVLEETFIDLASGFGPSALSELGETESLRLQMGMDRVSKSMSSLSNALQKASDTASAVTQNLDRGAPPDPSEVVEGLVNPVAHEVKALEDEIALLQQEISVDAASGSASPLSEFGEMESLRLQMGMDRLSKAVTSVSNFLKESSETASAITQNMR